MTLPEWKRLAKAWSSSARSRSALHPDPNQPGSGNPLLLVDIEGVNEVKALDDATLHKIHYHLPVICLADIEILLEEKASISTTAWCTRSSARCSITPKRPSRPASAAPRAIPTAPRRCSSIAVAIAITVVRTTAPITGDATCKPSFSRCLAPRPCNPPADVIQSAHG